MEYIYLPQAAFIYIFDIPPQYIYPQIQELRPTFFYIPPWIKMLEKILLLISLLYVLLHVGHTTSFFSSCETFIYCTITYFITVHMAWLVLIFLRLNWLFLSSSKSIFNDKTIRFNFRWLIVIYFTVFRSFGLHTKVFHTKGRHLCLGRIQYVQILL